MESIASKLKTKRESLNISLEQISKDTRISIHHLISLENGNYDNLPGGMYRRAILRAYCDEIGLDKNEVLRCYDDEVAPRQEKPAITPVASQFFKFKTRTATVWCLIFVFGIGLFLGREWLISALSPYFSYGYGSTPGDLSAVPLVSAKAESVDTAKDAAKGAQIIDVREEITPAASLNSDNKTVEALSGRTDQSAFAADNAGLQPLRLEIVGKEECWLSVNSDETGVVSKILAPGEVGFYTAARTISLVVGNAGGVSLRINDRAAKKLGQSGQVVRLTIDKDTLQNLIDPSAS
jgi:cytoskeleton protein RodZ